MIVKNIVNEKLALLIEEEIVGDFKYRIDFVDCPSQDLYNKRIAKIPLEYNDQGYRVERGIDFDGEQIRSYYLLIDNKKSAHGGDFCDDPYENCKVLFSSFDMIKDKFSPNAQSILGDIMIRCKEKVDTK